MNIKSLLLGSAAALVAVSGARAADAVVMVEPEPMEYVRVCDVYGTGFFYIPGTETCLKIGGYVRMRFNASGEVNGDNADDIANPVTDLDDDVGDADDYNFNTQVRARIDVDAREETELGTLRAFARLQATNVSGGVDGDGNQTIGYGTSNNGVIIDQAYIQLGGLTMGKTDSLWAERDGLFTDNDFSVGDITNNQVRYTFAVAGFTASVSVEDEGDGDIIPDAVAQLAYEGGWGEAYISGIYDEDAVDPSGFQYTFFDDIDDGDDDNEDGAFALKAGVTLKDLIAAGSQFKVEGHYAFDPTEYASLAPGGYILSPEVDIEDGLGGRVSGFVPSEFQIGAAYQQQFGKLFAAVSGVYGETFDFVGVDGDDEDGAEYFGGALNVGYAITSNFSVLGEVSYTNVDEVPGIDDDLDRTRGFLEFKRSF